MNPRSARLRIASDHPALAGHFPGHPIVPGALLLDEALRIVDDVAQTDGVTAAGTHWHILNIKFHRIVRPGAELELDLAPQTGGALRIELRAADATVMSGLLERRA